MLTPIVGKWYLASIHLYGADVRVDAITQDAYGKPAVFAWVPLPSGTWEVLQVCKLSRETTPPAEREAALAKSIADTRWHAPELKPLADYCWEPIKRLPCDVPMRRQGTRFNSGDYGITHER